jgi:hypothetical protein
MKIVSVSGLLSVSKIAIRLLVNSFLLGPLAIVYALIAEALLTTHYSVLFNESDFVILAILVGGFFCSFACIAASMVILLPIAVYEFSRHDPPQNGIAVFRKYLPVPVLLTGMLGLIMWIAGELKPIPPEPLAIIISFYLTASTGLYLMSQQLIK